MGGDCSRRERIWEWRAESASHAARRGRRVAARGAGRLRFPDCRGRFPSGARDDETHNVIERQRRLGQEGRDLEDMRRLRLQLELDMHAGGIRPLRRADGLVTQHLRTAGLQEQGRVSCEIGEDR